MCRYGFNVGIISSCLLPHQSNRIVEINTMLSSIMDRAEYCIMGIMSISLTSFTLISGNQNFGTKLGTTVSRAIWINHAIPSASSLKAFSLHFKYGADYGNYSK